jgi:serine/threonine-protein kinase
MDQTQGSNNPEDSPASAAGESAGFDTTALWGNNGLIGDGRYQLARRLGRGGMAEVFAAEDLRLGRTVAIKLLRADLAEDPISKARFTREAQSVAGLNHHAVVAVYDSGEDWIGKDQVPYIVMELCEGRTIRDLLIDADAPPVDQALIIVSGVLEALAYSHQHGIVHRDIKPANVIITTMGAVKVMDFGIARALHGASNTMTQTGMVMGTPQYLSPEQALGKAVDHRSDLYATGCLLYELLTLCPPFTGESPLSVVYQHVQDDPKIPSEVNDRVPPELDGLVLRSLAKNPDDRFQSAEEMHGLVQYALRMLHEQGGWTGTWDTGHVPVGDGATTVLRQQTARAPQTAQTARIGQTSELGPPLLMGPPGGDGEGSDGYGHRYRDGNGDDGGGGGRGGKVLMVVAAAILVIGIGIFIAMNASSHNNRQGNPSPSATPSATPSESPSVSPSDTSLPTSQPTDTSTEPSYPRTSTPTYTSPTTVPTPTPTFVQPTVPVQTPTPTPTGGGTPAPTPTGIATPTGPPKPSPTLPNR